MFWSMWYHKRKFIRVALKNQELEKETKTIFLWLKQFMKVYSNLNSEKFNFALNFETQRYSKLYFISMVINIILVMFSTLTSLTFIWISVKSFLDLNDSFNLNYKFTLIFSLLNIIFIVRFNADLLRFCLRGKLINDWKFKFLIIDILTLNILSIIFFKFTKNINDYLEPKKFNFNQSGLQSLQKVSNWWLILILVTTIISMLLSLFFGFLAIKFNLYSLKIVSVMFLIIFLIIWVFWISTYIPALIISKFLINSLCKNHNQISATTCLSLIRYLYIAVDFNLATIFIAKLNLHQELIKNNYYSEV